MIFGGGVLVPGHPLEAGDDAVELAGIARQPVGEGAEIVDHAVQRLGILGKDQIDAPQRIARGLRHALARAGLRDQGRHAARGGDLLAAFQRHDRHAGEALEVEPHLGVRSHRRVGRHRDGRVDPARIVGRKLQPRDFADADAVEQHGGADQQPRHRAVELQMIGAARAHPCGIVQPIDEAEDGGDGRKQEGADDDEGSSGFHVSQSGCLCSISERLPWK